MDYIRPPTRKIALGASSGPTSGWEQKLRDAGFRVEGAGPTFGICHPCRITEYYGVAVYVEQWD